MVACHTNPLVQIHAAKFSSHAGDVKPAHTSRPRTGAATESFSSDTGSTGGLIAVVLLARSTAGLVVVALLARSTARLTTVVIPVGLLSVLWKGVDVDVEVRGRVYDQNV